MNIEMKDDHRQRAVGPRPRPAHRAGRAAGRRRPRSSRSCRWASERRGRRARRAAPRSTTILDRERRPPAGRRRPVQRPRPRGGRSSTPSASPSAPADARATTCCVAMRVYFEKPRTTTGWKGLINDPHLDGSGDVNAGLRMARGLLLEVLDARPAGRLRVPRPDHAAVHRRRRRLGRDRRAHDREPDPPPARLRPLDAGRLQEPHRRQRPGRRRRGARRGRPARLRRRRRRAARRRSSTPRGNPRLPRHPARRPRRAQLRRRAGGRARSAQLRAAGLPERLVIDASHDNSGKDHERQPRGRRRRSPTRSPPASGAIVGVMLESFLVAGRQDLGRTRPLVYGQSITDACMDWDTTVLTCSTGSPRRCASGARPAEPAMRIAVLGVGPDRRLDRARRARSGSDAEVVGLRPRPAPLVDRAVELGRDRRAPPSSSRRRVRGRRDRLLRRAGRRAARPGRARRSTPRGDGLRRHRRRLDQARARRRARRRRAASSAATRSPAPRPPASRTPAPTCSRAPAGT